MSLKAVGNTSEKQQQQQIPLVEYATVDNNKNQNLQQHNLCSQYDEINDNNINTGVSVQLGEIQYFY